MTEVWLGPQDELPQCLTANAIRLNGYSAQLLREHMERCPTCQKRQRLANLQAMNAVHPPFEDEQAYIVIDKRFTHLKKLEVSQ